MQSNHVYNYRVQLKRSIDRIVEDSADYSVIELFCEVKSGLLAIIWNYPKLASIISIAIWNKGPFSAEIGQPRRAPECEAVSGWSEAGQKIQCLAGRLTKRAFA